MISMIVANYLLPCKDEANLGWKSEVFERKLVFRQIKKKFKY